MESKTINIKIKTLDNSLHEFNVNKDMSVIELKNRINEVKFCMIAKLQQMKIPIHRQRIIFQGKMMKNSDNLSNYKVKQKK